MDVIMRNFIKILLRAISTLLLQKKQKVQSQIYKFLHIFARNLFWIWINIQMSKAFKKKKQEPAEQLGAKLDFLLGSQIFSGVQKQPAKLQRALILKSAMFWDSKSRVQRIKGLVLGNMSLTEFQDVDDFRIDELTSIELLSLSKNAIIHLQPISVLDTLITLNINHNKVYDLSPLQDLSLLQELYASNNQINNIEPLAKLENLRVLNLYSNKIAVAERAMKVLQRLGSLEDLDVEQNPFYCEQSRRLLITLPISRLNDKLIPKTEKNQINTPSSINMSASCVINPLSMSMMRQSNTSFFNPSTKSIKRNKAKELKEKLEHLQEEYFKIDDEFQEQIVNNVLLKSEFHKKLQKVKEMENQKQQNQYKAQQIKLMKRKAKDLKENLFKIQSKGKLLRQLFTLETQSIPKTTTAKETTVKKVTWVRKFDCDDVILIEDDKHYLEEDKQLAELLDSNSNTLEELRRELEYLS